MRAMPLTMIFAGLVSLSALAGCEWGDCDDGGPVTAAEVDDTMDHLDAEYAYDCFQLGSAQAGMYVDGSDAYGNPVWEAYISVWPEATCSGMEVNDVVVTYGGEYYSDVFMTISRGDVEYTVGDDESYGDFMGDEEVEANILMDAMWYDFPVTFWLMDKHEDTIWGAVSLRVTECTQVTSVEYLCEYEAVSVELG